MAHGQVKRTALSRHVAIDPPKHDNTSSQFSFLKGTLILYIALVSFMCGMFLMYAHRLHH